jgi:tetratricopeptide (TPR) repeat protein
MILFVILKSPAVDRSVANVRHLTRAIALTAFIVAASGAMADEWNVPVPGGCGALDPERRIAPCSALIDAPDVAPDVRAKAFFMRGLAFWQLNQRERAVGDYDQAIRIAPRHAPALNNRADAYLRLGRPSQGMPDIDRALEIEPQNPIYNATRGQIGQSVGDPQGAMRDHDAAMAFGGPVFIKLYQCGLRLAALYRGPIDGVLRAEMHTALRQCVDQGSHCDPVPESANTECREPVA